MEFISLKALIYDILGILRDSKISDDEDLSERRIESYIHQYRALLLKQDIEKGFYANPDYIQEYRNADGSLIALEIADVDGVSCIRTNVQIPKTLDLHYKSGLTFIGDSRGNQIPLVPESRVKWQAYRKYTAGHPVAYLRDRYIYLMNANSLTSLQIRGIFEIPTEIPGYGLNDKYPLPLDKVNTLKDMLFKNEFNIETAEHGDIKNDGSNVMPK
jgi:hypothetical protein